MSGTGLSGGHLRDGVWHAVLTAVDRPRVEALHQRTRLDGVTVVPDGEAAGVWRLAVPVPAALLSDGVQTVLIVEAETQTMLGRFTLICGQPVEADLRSEIDLLRAEIDMLKRVLRAHLRGDPS